MIMHKEDKKGEMKTIKNIDNPFYIQNHTIMHKIVNLTETYSKKNNKKRSSIHFKNPEHNLDKILFSLIHCNGVTEDNWIVRSS